MKNGLKAAALGFGIGLATAAVAQPVQQPPYQGQMPMSQMGQGMAQMSPMMSDPQMRAQMSQMRQGCERMMSIMGDRMRRPDSTRR